MVDSNRKQDGKRYYQVKWRESWEPEERLMAACEGALKVFWKEYYANVEKEIRKQVETASKSLMVPSSNEVTFTEAKGVSNISANVQLPVTTIPTTSNIIETFPEQSSTVAYYAVQDNNESNTENTHEREIVSRLEISDQAEILTQIINAAPNITATKWPEQKDVNANRRTLTTITADTLNTKNVRGPDANSKFHCDICMKKFVSKRNVQRHMLSHTGEKPWMCEFCFKRFRQKPHLEQHVNIHKGIKNAICSVCGKAFNHRSNLVTHMATHSTARPHSCKLCGENFKLKHTLAKHMMVHTKQDVDKRHQCQICKRSFRDKSYLAEHETIHQKEKPWRCDICQKSFSFKRRFQMHLEVHQSKDGGDEFTCHLCTKRFKSKIYLQKHLERHESKRRRKKKRRKEREAAALMHGGEGIGGDENESNNGLVVDDDGELSMSEVDIKAEGEIEEGEAISLHPNLKESSQHTSQIIQIEGNGENETNMVVASMLPINELNLEDQATYVALAQLTQAAIDNAPIDESGNVILMSYEDIHKSMQEIQVSQHEQQDGVNIGIHDIQVAQQQEGENLHVVLEAHHPRHHTEHGEYEQHSQVIHDHNVDHSQVMRDHAVDHSQVMHDHNTEHTQTLHDQSVEHTQVIHDQSVEHSQVIHDQTVEHSQVMHDQNVELRNIDHVQMNLHVAN